LVFFFFFFFLSVFSALDTIAKEGRWLTGEDAVLDARSTSCGMSCKAKCWGLKTLGN